MRSIGLSDKCTSVGPSIPRPHVCKRVDNDNSFQSKKYENYINLEYLVLCVNVRISFGSFNADMHGMLQPLSFFHIVVAAQYLVY